MTDVTLAFFLPDSPFSRLRAFLDISELFGQRV